jgi:hypothetical protein
MNIYGTFANQNFLPQLLAFTNSFHEKTKDARLAIFALDDQTHQVIGNLGFDRVDLFMLKDLENFHFDLLAAKSNRLESEYFFTLTSAVPSFLIARYPSYNFAIYVDADLYLFANPDFVLGKLDSSINVLLTPHNFSSTDLDLLVFGEFNTGFVAFRINSTSVELAEWWLRSCLTWCEDRTEDNKFADQKYLESFSGIIDGVLTSDEFGLNLGPWGLNSLRTLSDVSPECRVNNQKLFAYHFSGTRWNRWGVILGAWPYRHRISKTLFTTIYLPYLKELKMWEKYLLTCELEVDSNKSKQYLRISRKLTIKVILRAIMANDIRGWWSVKYDSNK